MLPQFAIVGAGLIGAKRAEALTALKLPIVGVYDVDGPRAVAFAQKFQSRAFPSLQALLTESSCTHVIVATTNAAAPVAGRAALEHGKSVLVEKPAGCTPADIAMMQGAVKPGQICRVGFNHRFHPALLEAKQLLSKEALGKILYFRGRYGHGGRPGYDREWRANPEVSGGGELLDQGVHLIDLTRWLGGEFALAFGAIHTFHWDMPVEDNGFLYLLSPDKQRAAWLHASCTEWKNTFELEVFGTEGKLQVTGLGRSYGEEKLLYYRRKPEGGVPDLQTFAFEQADHSWENEINAFLLEQTGMQTPIATLEDAKQALAIVTQTYQSNH